MEYLKKITGISCVLYIGVIMLSCSTIVDNDSEYESLIKKVEKLKVEKDFLTKKIGGIERKKDSVIDTKQLIDSNKVRLLLPRIIGNDGININEYTGLNWVGLSYGLNRSHVGISNATVQIVPIKSFTDSNNYYFPDGVKVTCPDCMDSTFLLISGIEKLKTNRIIDTKNTSNFLLPGHSFNLGNFKIKAYGDSILNNSNWGYKNYKLVMTGRKKGEFIQQVFLEVDWFDDNMVEFIWVGDIDGDQIPDLFMDISHKYSFSRFVLYLSSVSNENELLKKVDELYEYGC